jgi:hypothetical protein
MQKMISFLMASILVLNAGTDLSGQALKVRLVKNDEKQKVDVMIDGELFTSFIHPTNLEKPILFPIMSSNGSVLTRGFPLDPRKGERVDTPHQVGLWFNHGNVNGLDFWNNSSAIPPGKKDAYGHIVVKQISKVKSGKQGILEVISNWDDNKGNTLLEEKTTFIFSGDKNSRTIDHISTLTAINDPVTFTDNKEGMFAIRVDRAFEMPSNEPLIFTDDKGNPTTVKATDNAGVTGMYTSSSGLKGDRVWSSRNDWVMLSGTKDNVLTTMAVFDHPKNTGYPAHSHARGYGLFSTNNLGANSYLPSEKKIVVTLQKGESITLRHRFYIQSGTELTPEKANKIFGEFAKLY